MKISIGYITSREHNELDWLTASLEKQVRPDDEIELIVVDSNVQFETQCQALNIFAKKVKPKPCIWSGDHRVTVDNWWSKANSINTFLCLAKHDFVVMVDDRSVLLPGSLDAIRAAHAKKYVMCGAYQKRHSMTVEDGFIRNGGIITAEDGRNPSSNQPVTCGGEWMFGCLTAAPLEWWLNINGSPEKCDSLSFEDVITGFLFQNNGYPLKYDRRAILVEDRTADKLGDAMKRSSKEKHPHDTSDKAHTLLRWVKGGAKRSENPFDIRELRKAIQAGDSFSIPDPQVIYKDWFDGQPLSEFK